MKKMLCSALVVCLVFVFNACKNGDESFLFSDVSPQSTETVDESTLTLNPTFAWRLSNESLALPLPSQDKVISENKALNKLEMRDSKTGALEWSWSDPLNPGSQLDVPNKRNSYLHDDLLFYYHDSKYYCINLKNGETIWKKELPSEVRNCDEIITGVGADYFQVRNIDVDTDRKKEVVFKGDIRSAEPMEMILAPSFQTEIAGPRQNIGRINDLEAFQKSNGDLLLAIAYGEPTVDEEWNTFLGVWNVNQAIWEYKDILVMTARRMGKLRKDGDRLYCYSNLQLSCFEEKDGTLLWEKTNGDQYSFFAFASDYILYHHLNAPLELVDAQSGNVIWTQSISFETNTTLTNNHVYLINDVLQVLDIETGALKKEISSPYENYPASAAYFEGCKRVTSFENKRGKDQLILSTQDYMFGMELD